MKEIIFLNTIRKVLSNTEYLGDDCANLKELGIAVTQDTLVENVHFSMKYCNAYQLGYKAIVVNLSDLFAAGAKPEYISISLSLPPDTTEGFIHDFYKATDELAKKYDFKVIGGDITGSEKIVISICAIGKTKNRNISSRAFAKEGYTVIVTGEHGSSSAGLELLQSGKFNEKFVNAHLMPEISSDFSEEISTKTLKPYAMADSSDGLADALFKIAESSNVTICVDFDKIPYEKDLEKFDYKKKILFGGEDYKLVATVDKTELEKISSNLYTIIGTVEKKESCPLKIRTKDKIIKIKDLENTFNHFKGD